MFHNKIRRDSIHNFCYLEQKGLNLKNKEKELKNIQTLNLNDNPKDL